MKFAVIGGDMRFAYLAEQLLQDGHKVRRFAAENADVADAVDADSAKAAMDGVDCVILPLPALNSDGTLNALYAARSHDAREITEAVAEGQLVCAGRVDDRLRELLDERGAVVVDYFAREEMTVANAAVTAEGAVQTAMQELKSTLWGSRVLVIGNGRIGKLLAPRLAALGAEVTVSARKYSDFAWIEAMGYRAADTRELDGRLKEYDVIFNTVPARVLGERRLNGLKEGCLIVDVASRPGGVDMNAAAALGTKVIWALGLPGRTAPQTAGKIIRDTVYNILEEKVRSGG